MLSVKEQSTCLPFPVVDLSSLQAGDLRSLDGLHLELSKTQLEPVTASQARRRIPSHSPEEDRLFVLSSC